MKRAGLALLAAAAIAATTACNGDDGDAGVATDLLYVSGNLQTANTGAQLPQPLVVEVLNASDEPVEGVQLRWTAVGGATLAAGITNTDELGRSTNTVTLGAAAGVQTVTVVAVGLDIGTVTFEATAIEPGGGGGGGGGGELP